MNLAEIASTNAESRLSEDVRFSICTLVTRPDQYAEMIESFHTRGFSRDDCEFLHIDNTKTNARDAYEGFNFFLNVARGTYVVVCHQDVLLIDDRAHLERVLAELDRHDPDWAACGNSGGMAPGRLAIRISDPHAMDQRTATLPAKVHSLDENFILVRRAANLSVSRDLGGFHLYGADLCILAEITGHSTYVVDFHLRHLSAGTRDGSLASSRRRLVAKYSRALSWRWVMAPCELVFLSSVPWLSGLLSSSLTRRLLLRVLPKK